MTNTRAKKKRSLIDCALLYLVNLHDGLIEFDSVPGNTVFRVLLPLNSEQRFNIKN